MSRVFRNPDLSRHHVWSASARRRVINMAFLVGPRQRMTSDRCVVVTVVSGQRTCQSLHVHALVDNRNFHTSLVLYLIFQMKVTLRQLQHEISLIVHYNVVSSADFN